MLSNNKLPLYSVLPGETVRSILGRHMIREAVSRIQLLQQVSGRKRVRLSPVLPCFLEGIERANIGDFETMLNQHTLFPLYAFFLDAPQRQALSAAMAGKWPQRVAQIIGWSANQLDSSHVEQYCPECAREDMLNLGVSYWHREHQLPFVFACWKHGVRLETVSLPLSGWDQFYEIPLDVVTQQAEAKAVEFAHFVQQAIALASETRPADLSSVYRIKLVQRNMITPCGRVKRRLISEALGDLVALRKSGEIGPRNLPRLRNYRELLDHSGCFRQHLMAHLYFAFTFFENPADLVGEVHDCINEDQAVLGEVEKPEMSLRCLSAGMSLNKTSKVSGRSRTYLKRLAKLHSIPICECPRILTKSRRKKIQEMAWQGISAQEIASALGLKVSLIQLVINETPQLKEYRVKVRGKRKGEEVRTRFLSLVSKNPNLSRSQIQGVLSKEYHWLYRNDRQWLYRVLPDRCHTTPPTRVNWLQRDNELFCKVEAMLLNGWQASSWSSVDLDLGGHGWLTKNRTKLPKTVDLLGRSLNLD